MLRLTLELLPYGSEKGKKLLKRIDIANDGSHDIPFMFADYKVKVNDNPHTEAIWKYKFLTDYPRKKYDALYLCYLVLRKLVHEHFDPIDSKAERDREASGGPGHSLVPDSKRSVGVRGYKPRSPRRT